MASRYSKGFFIQPKRAIPFAITDFNHTLNQFENIDQLAYKYYKDSTLGWIIMLANPKWNFEFEITPGSEIRIPFPLTRVWAQLSINSEI